MPFFTFQVTKIVKDVNSRRIEFPKSNENIYGKVTTITLVEVPFMDLLEPRPIKQSTVIWYEWLAAGKKHTADIIEFQKNLIKEKGDKCPFEVCDTQPDAMNLIGQSIRANIIVSEEGGYNFIEDMFSGLAVNYSIMNIILYQRDIKDSERLGSIVNLVQQFNARMEKKAAAEKKTAVPSVNISMVNDMNTLKSKINLDPGSYSKFIKG